MRIGLILPLCLLVTACQEPVQQKPDDGPVQPAAVALDRQAMRAGILGGNNDNDLVGRFETHSELGVDKFCAFGRDKENLRIGVIAVFGGESKCEGRGSASVDNGMVNIRLEGKGRCNMTASFDGVELRLPGEVEAGCAAYCTPRASFAGASFFMIEQGNDRAKRVVGRDIPRLCG